VEILVIPILFASAVVLGILFDRPKHDEFDVEHLIYTQFEDAHENRHDAAYLDRRT
jgi:hypothetical protein